MSNVKHAMDDYDQQALLDELCGIFPDFGSAWASEHEDDDEEFRSSSLHSVYMCLLPILSSFHPTDRQWKEFGEHLSAAVIAGGDRENAADTCVLEHLHQVGFAKKLRPLLSEKARGYLYD